jgi:hypothetical protein
MAREISDAWLSIITLSLNNNDKHQTKFDGEPILAEVRAVRMRSPPPGAALAATVTAVSRWLFMYNTTGLTLHRCSQLPWDSFLLLFTSISLRLS